MICKKMLNFRVIVITSLVLTVVLSATGQGRDPHLKVFPRSITSVGARNRGVVVGVGSPTEWTMSKADLVAEFFTSEASPRSSRETVDRSPKSIFSFFTGNSNNNESSSGNGNDYVPSPPTTINQRMSPPPPPTQSIEKKDQNAVASGPGYHQQVIPFDASRHAANILVGGGYTNPFRPIPRPQQNFLFHSGSPASGYPLQNVRPPRGPPPSPPTRQFIWDTRPINGLRPPPVISLQQQQQSPPSAYLPPQPQSHTPQLQLPKPQPLTQNPSPSQYPVPTQRNNTAFNPSPEYLPSSQKPIQNVPQFQPASPSPQILDTYSKQAVYPPPSPEQYTTEKPLVYVMANSSFDQSSTGHQTFQQPQNNINPLNSYTQYENESVPPPPPVSSLQQEQYLPPSPQTSPQNQKQPNPVSGYPTQTPSLNGLALTEPLSQVLAEANSKAGDAMDKTIRFVIHKPEDEDIVKNAILEDAQNRYEDVKFVQGPTLKVQRKETVYLPPKKKTVVYILLKEPQIDTDVQVMTPQEDEAAPEVYITYQKSDGAVKTKHYSPKPIKQEDMQKYLDIEEDPYAAAGEESRIHPRISKSTSVSLSTSSKVSRKTASTSVSSVSPMEQQLFKKSFNGTSSSDDDNPSRLANHRMSSPSSNETVSEIKSSPLLYTSRYINQIQISNSTSSVRLPEKKPRSSGYQQVYPTPRRVLRHHPICANAKKAK